MDFDTYQVEVRRTAGRWESFSEQLAVLGLGIAGEAGEVADIIKKVVGHRHILDRDTLAGELGDVLWYVAAMCDHLGVSIESVAAANIEKLRKRYPDGFSTERSIARPDAEPK